MIVVRRCSPAARARSQDRSRGNEKDGDILASIWAEAEDIIYCKGISCCKPALRISGYTLPS